MQLITKLYVAVFAGAMCCSVAAKAQITIGAGSSFVIENGAALRVPGNLVSSGDLTGAGKVVLQGTTEQSINMNGFTISNLEINNTANATLAGNLRISSNINFINGKISLGPVTATLAAPVTVTGAGTNKFFEATGTGALRRELSADVTGSLLPLGTGSNYTPLSINNSGSTYASAFISAQAKGSSEPNKHPRTESYLNTYWAISKTGITGGTTIATGTYVDPTQVSGTKADLFGLFWNGSAWSNAGSSQNVAANSATAQITTNSGNLYAMNKFVLSRLKVLLQGPLVNSTMIMNDNLRAAPSLIPTSDPYRSAPYNTAFTHVANTNAETVAASVFNNAASANDNIVDWVFVELRQGISPGNTVIQTRSGLLQRDGDIVDVDGVSPLYFRNLDPNSNYSFCVRHRNHLGIYTNTLTAGNLFSLNLAAPATVDISSLAAGALFGTAGSNYASVSGRNIMFAGNVNLNTSIDWDAAGSDKNYLLSNILGNNAATILSTYGIGDVNMNGVTRWNPPYSDRDFILGNPLSASSAAVRTQVSPN